MFSYTIFTEISFLNLWSDNMYVNKNLDGTFIDKNVPILFKKLPLFMIIAGALIVYFFVFLFKTNLTFYKIKIKFHLQFL